MKILFMIAMTVGTSLASAETIIYCGRLGDVGSNVKIHPGLQIMCINSGQWGDDYCSRPSAKVFQLTEKRYGKVYLGFQEFEFTEYVAKAGTEIQTVRVYDDVSKSGGGELTIHRADLAGPFLLLNTNPPIIEPQNGEPTCTRGDDFSF